MAGWVGINSSYLDSDCGDSNNNTLAEALDGTDLWRHNVEETHQFILDLSTIYSIQKVRGRSDMAGDPLDINIYVSDDKTNWGTAVAANITTWQSTTSWVEIDVTNKNGRYIKIEIVDVRSAGGFKYLMYGAVAPSMTIFDVYGVKVENAMFMGANF